MKRARITLQGTVRADVADAVHTAIAHNVARRLAVEDYGGVQQWLEDNGYRMDDAGIREFRDVMRAILHLPGDDR